MNSSTEKPEGGDASTSIPELRMRLCKGWREGRRVSIEELLATVPGELQAAAFEVLLRDERVTAEALGIAVGSEEYHRRFPQFSLLIEQTFGGQTVAMASGQCDANSDPFGSEGEDDRRLLDQFEQAWKETQLPQLSAFLPSNRELWAKVGPQLVALDWNHREQKGLSPRPSDYREWPPEWLPQTPGHSRMKTVSAKQSRAEQPTLEVGDRVHYLGDYELLEPLGKGGMGVVYKARQLSLNRVVALKWILDKGQSSPREVERFYIEAEAAANLNHPGIVPIYEIGQHNRQPYYSMAYVPGPTLAELVKKGPLAAPAAADLVEKIATAVAYAHNQGVIHRDLKPANVLLDPQGVPKVTDFGLARQIDRESGLTQTGDVLGTPSYMSPEQAAGQTDLIGPPSDIYSLGAMLFCLLTGRPPFQAATVNETLQQVREQEPVSLRLINGSVPRDLETICQKCLQKVPARRYVTAGDLAADLGRFLRGEPITARPVSAFERGVRWMQRNRATASMGLIAAAAILLGSATSIRFGLAASNEAKAARSAEFEAKKSEAAAKVAERQAREAQVRAEMSESLARKSELSALEKSADVAVRKGDWTEALMLIQRALGLTVDSEQKVKLGIELAKAQWVLSLKQECRETLKNLREQALHGPLRHRVMLWSGVIDSGIGSAQASRWLEEAGAAETEGSLSPEEKSLVRALLAPNSAETVRHLGELLKENPFFPAAQHLLIYTHLIRGERLLAHREIEIAQRLHPGDPNTAVAQALLLAYEMTPPEVAERLPALLAQMPEGVRPIMETIVPLVASEIDQFRHPQVSTPLARQIPRLIEKFGTLITTGINNGQDEILIGPAVFLVKRWFPNVMNPFFGLRLMNPESLVTEIMRYDLMGDLALIRAKSLQARGALAEAEADLLAAEGRLLAPLETERLAELVITQSLRADQAGKPFAAASNPHARRAVDNLRRLHDAMNQSGPPRAEEWRVWIEPLVSLCRAFEQFELGHDFIDLWDARHPPAAWTLRLRGDLLCVSHPPELFRALDCYRRALELTPAADGTHTDLECLIHDMCWRIHETARGLTFPAESALSRP